MEFIERVHEASKQDQEWQEQKPELSELEPHHFQLPENWQIIDELIYFKNRLLLRTELLKG